LNPPASSSTIEADKFLGAFEANSSQSDAISRLWAVWFFSLWDEDYRHRLAAAHGCQARDFQHDYFGDLANLRNDIAHRKGVTRPTPYRVLKSFRPNEKVSLRHPHFREIVDLFPWSYLSKKPEPAPVKIHTVGVAIDRHLATEIKSVAASTGKGAEAAVHEALTAWLARNRE